MACSGTPVINTSWYYTVGTVLTRTGTTSRLLVHTAGMVVCFAWHCCVDIKREAEILRMYTTRKQILVPRPQCLFILVLRYCIVSPKKHIRFQTTTLLPPSSYNLSLPYFVLLTSPFRRLWSRSSTSTDAHGFLATCSGTRYSVGTEYSCQSSQV